VTAFAPTPTTPSTPTACNRGARSKPPAPAAAAAAGVGDGTGAAAGFGTVRLGAAGFDAAPKVGSLKPAELPLLVAGAAGFGVEAGEFEASAARRCRMPRSVLPEERAPLLKDSSSDSEPVLDAVMLFSSYTWVTNK